jgi:hypothetical protein
LLNLWDAQILSETPRTEDAKLASTSDVSTDPQAKDPAQNSDLGPGMG